MQRLQQRHSIMANKLIRLKPFFVELFRSRRVQDVCGGPPIFLKKSLQFEYASAIQYLTFK